ncbi:MAG: hypothetical protein WCH39_12230 [Schlesneria sp.]
MNALRIDDQSRESEKDHGIQKEKSQSATKENFQQPISHYELNKWSPPFIRRRMLSGIDLGQDHLKNESLDDLPNVKKQHANIYLQMIKIFVKIMSLSHGLAETGK